jgi:hypothetical protein
MKFEEQKCKICDKEIPKNGAAWTSHMRMHVRKNEAIEEKDPNTGKLIFKDPNKPEYTELPPYAKLGQEPIKPQPKGVWDMTEALNELQSIDPQSYYITSGEAIRKAEKLTKDAYSLAAKANNLHKSLIKAKSEAKYLETQREDGRLLVKKKSPRTRK